MFSNALHEDLMRLRLAPNKSLANVRKMPLKQAQNQGILKATRIVRFPEFYEKAIRVFWSIADATRVLRDKDVVLFVQPHKSNEWLAALFMDFLKRTGMKDVFDRVRFSEDADAANSIVVFLDDATYSGSQMVDFLADYVPNIESSLVIVGIPFVTTRALQNIRKELEGHSDRLASMILYADVMEPMSERNARPAIYFDHKVPDSVSTYATYDRYLDPNAVRPFYKNENWNPGESIEEPVRVSLNASFIPLPRAVTIEHNPERNAQNGRRNLVTYGDLNF